MIKFLHVVKTGGSTLGKHLKKHYPGYRDVRVDGPADADTTLAQGHLEQISFEPRDGNHYITIVRDPGTWYPSVYNQDVSRTESDLDFWQWYERGGKNTVIPRPGATDRQFVYLAEMMHAENLSEVLWALDGFWWLTATEWLDYDVDWLCKHLNIPSRFDRWYRVAGKRDEIDGIEIEKRFIPSRADRERLREENPLDTLMWKYVLGERERRYGR